MCTRAALPVVGLLSVLWLLTPVVGAEPEVATEALQSGAALDVIGRPYTVSADQVVGPLRVGNGHLEVLGRVRGDVTATRSPVVIRDGGVVEGDVRSFAGPVTVASGGTVEGSVTVNAAEGRVRSGGWVKGDLSTFGADATVEAGGEVGGKVTAIRGQRVVHSAAIVGGAVARGRGGDPGGGAVAIGAIAFVLWLVGAVLGGAFCYAMAQSAPARLEVIASVWRQRARQAASWALSLVGLTVLLALVPCIGWLAAVVLLVALIGAAVLAWPVALRLLGERISRHGPGNPRAATWTGFALWTAIGLIGVFPCLLPFVLLAKWLVLLLAAAVALLTNWGRDPLGGGCWPLRRVWDPLDPLDEPPS